MNYTYSQHYGFNTSNYDWDKLVDKGLATNLKEEKLSIQQLCAKIQHESQVAIDQARHYGWIRPAHERLFNWLGGYAVVNGYVCTVDYHNKVQDKLYPLREFWQRVFTQTESYYDLWNFWTNAIAHAEKGI